MSSRYTLCSKCGSLNKLPTKILSTQNPKCGHCKEKILHQKSVFEVNESTLANAISHCPLPILVDCWAEWCGPCKSFAPVFENFALETLEKCLCVKLDTETNQNFSARQGIRSIPTIILYKDGKEIGRQAGAMSKIQLQTWLTKSLGQT